MQIRSGVWVALLMGTGMAACTVAGPRVTVHPPELAVTEIVVARPPPPMRVEPPPPLPQGHPERFVWQPGHWRWDGHEYNWHPGHYEKRPARDANWIPAEWVSRDGQWVYRPGHWVYR